MQTSKASLAWTLKYGGMTEFFQEEANEAETWEDIPKPLRECPELPERSAPFMSAFLTLSAGRSGGYAMANAITTADALAYWQACPFCEPLYFLDVIRAMDELWMQDAAERAEVAGRRSPKE